MSSQFSMLGKYGGLLAKNIGQVLAGWKFGCQHVERCGDKPWRKDRRSFVN